MCNLLLDCLYFRESASSADMVVAHGARRAICIHLGALVAIATIKIKCSFPISGGLIRSTLGRFFGKQIGVGEVSQVTRKV